MTHSKHRPGKSIWYKEPYFWLVVLFPAMAVVAGFYTLRLAIVSDDGLVVDDYYKKGLEINRVLDRERAAQRYGLSGDLDVEKAQGLVKVELNAQASFKYPPALHVQFMHATRAGFDREATLERVGKNSYEGKLPDLAPGHWYIQIEADDWRLLDSYQSHG